MSEKNSGSGFLVISYICLEAVDEGVTKIEDSLVHLLVGSTGLTGSAPRLTPVSAIKFLKKSPD